jgi:hypothetical protein
LFDFIKFIGDFLHYNKFDQFLDTSKSIGWFIDEMQVLLLFFTIYQ